MNHILIIIIIVGVVILLSFQALGLLLILVLLRKREEQVDFIQNADIMARKFCYRVEKSAEEIFSILSIPGHFEDYRYSFDRREMIITFSRELVPPDARYWVFLYPDAAGCNLRIEAIDGWGTGNSCPQIQNSFWQHMLDARPIPIFEEERT